MDYDDYCNCNYGEGEFWIGDPSDRSIYFSYFWEAPHHVELNEVLYNDGHRLSYLSPDDDEFDERTLDAFIEELGIDDFRKNINGIPPNVDAFEFLDGHNLKKITIVDTYSMVELLSEGRLLLDSKKLSTLIISEDFSGVLPTKNGIALEDFNITTIVIKTTTPPSIETNGISQVMFENMEVLVPTNSLRAFQKAFGWNRFKKLKGGAENYSLPNTTPATPPLRFTVGELHYEMQPNSTTTCAVVAGEKKYTGDIIIPDTITYNGKSLKITGIRYGAFRNCWELTSVCIGENVQDIGSFAFAGCENLQAVHIGKSVKAIGYSAFRGCGSLAYVNIPDSVKFIFPFAFFSLFSLRLVKLGGNVKFIGYCAFDCGHISTINFGNNVERIDFCPDGSDIQFLCLGRNVLYAPKSLIGENTIAQLELGNSELMSLFLQTRPQIRPQIRQKKRRRLILKTSGASEARPHQIPTLIIAEDYSSAKIPTTSTNGSTQHFLQDHESLKTLVCKKKTPIPIESDGISTTQYMNLEVVVPTASLDEYKNAPVWKNFRNIKGGAENYDTGVVNLITYEKRDTFPY